MNTVDKLELLPESIEALPQAELDQLLRQTLELIEIAEAIRDLEIAGISDDKRAVAALVKDELLNSAKQKSLKPRQFGYQGKSLYDRIHSLEQSLEIIQSIAQPKPFPISGSSH
jgi:hypothetical protein